VQSLLVVSKKSKNWLNWENWETNNRKNRTMKKNQLKFQKNRQVWFWFYKPETEKTRKNRIKPEKSSQIGKNRDRPKKPSQTSLNRFFLKKPNRNRSVWTGFFLKNRTKTGRFEPVSVRLRFFIKKFSLIIFFIKPIQTKNNFPNPYWARKH
jgi:hypothetical protein